MNGKTRIKFCFEVEPFKEDAYNFLVKSSTQKHFVEMTSRSSLNDVGLFIGSLLAFNNLPLDYEFIEALSKKEELALVGGLLFEKSNFKIGASCCADFQDWVVVGEDIKRGASPWMGHDPSLWFDFKDENIIVWSDEDKRENIYCIQLTQKEFDIQLSRAKQELHYFLEKIKVWAVQNYKDDCHQLVDGMKNYLFVHQY